MNIEERANSKHGPRLDEQMAKEAQSGTPEPPADGEPDATGVPPGHHGVDTGDDRDPDRRDERAMIGAHLPRDVYPAEKAALVEAARRNDAPDGVIQALDRLPEGASFTDAAELWKTLGLHSDRQ